MAFGREVAAAFSGLSSPESVRCLFDSCRVVYSALSALTASCSSRCPRKFNPGLDCYHEPRVPSLLSFRRLRSLEIRLIRLLLSWSPVSIGFVDAPGQPSYPHLLTKRIKSQCEAVLRKRVFQDFGSAPEHQRLLLSVVDAIPSSLLRASRLETEWCLLSLPRSLPPSPAPSYVEENLMVERLASRGFPDRSEQVASDLRNFSKDFSLARARPLPPFELPMNTSATLNFPRDKGGFLSAISEKLRHVDVDAPEILSVIHSDDLSRVARSYQLLADAVCSIRQKLDSGLVFPLGRTEIVPDKGPKSRGVTPISEDFLVCAHYLRSRLFPLLLEEPSVSRSLSEKRSDHAIELIRSMRDTDVILSADLSVATDRIPFWVAQELLQGTLSGLREAGVAVADSFDDILLSLLGPYELRTTYQPDPSFVTKGGILMGVPCSWFFLNLYNLYCVSVASREVPDGLSGLMVNGDDLLATASPDWIVEYERTVTLLGGVFSVGKHFCHPSLWTFSGLYGVGSFVLPPLAWLSLKTAPRPQASLADANVPVWKRIGCTVEATYQCSIRNYPRLSSVVLDLSYFGLLGIGNWARDMNLPLRLPRELGGMGLRCRNGRWWDLTTCEVGALCDMCVDGIEQDSIPRGLVSLSSAINSTRTPWSSLVEPLEAQGHSYEIVNSLSLTSLDSPDILDVPLCEVSSRVLAVQSVDLMFTIGPDFEFLESQKHSYRVNGYRSLYWREISRLSGCPHGERGCRRRRVPLTEFFRESVAAILECFKVRRVTSDLCCPAAFLGILPGGVDKQWAFLVDQYRRRGDRELVRYLDRKKFLESVRDGTVTPRPGELHGKKLREAEEALASRHRRERAKIREGIRGINEEKVFKESVPTLVDEALLEGFGLSTGEYGETLRFYRACPG
ncbi:RNA-dependent RNA polymerase [Blechomonas maslovi narnavirus 1]|uniref:RNA-dependent RNA polymerase n=1 Tax=Blechomonas maslovi narnavirus 1 TaxID=2364202 RepID=UPI000EB69A3E|nr:RNA-dependent RNA polymerase [Blechomonas maslovi narnavirus 1]AYD61663.1 RNA-dependent RNA polymerase [Blechomonas maslovi narnavirus 1]